ncbi:Protein-serine-threonine phosphatase/Protein-tyrosine-phosphatase/4-nitrophenylphosphatase, partial [Scytalidium lignicola]
MACNLQSSVHQPGGWAAYPHGNRVMDAVDFISTTGQLTVLGMSTSGEAKGGNATTVSRRLVTATTTMTTVLPEEKEALSPTATVRGFDTKGREARISLTVDQNEWGGVLQDPRKSSAVPTTVRSGILPVVDLGKNISCVFPSNGVEMKELMTKCIETSRASATKIAGQPANFGLVLPGVYRSSYPQKEDFEFLRTLGLKSIVTLVKNDIPEDYKAFIESLGIKHFIIDMQGTKKEAISDSIMASIMELVLNPANHPILMHCNHGKHRTGCATAVIRHLSGWDLPAILAEYEGYASPKQRIDGNSIGEGLYGVFKWQSPQIWRVAAKGAFDHYKSGQKEPALEGL